MIKFCNTVASATRSVLQLCSQPTAVRYTEKQTKNWKEMVLWNSAAFMQQYVVKIIKLIDGLAKNLG